MKKTSLVTSVIFASLAGYSFAMTYPWTPPTDQEEHPGAYHYYYKRDSLQSVLRKFGSSYSIGLHFSNELPSNFLQKTVSGHFEAKTPTEFLDNLASNYDFKWFYYSGTLYICSSKMKSKPLYVAGDFMQSLKSILDNEGLISPQFGWSEVPSQSMVVVSGPKEYLSIVQERFNAFKVSPVGQQFAVFHLKYADAVDTYVYTQDDKPLLVPGVATILKALLSGTKNPDPNSNNRLLEQVVAPLKNSLNHLLPNGLNGPTNYSPQLGENGISSRYESDSSKDPTIATKALLTTPVIEGDRRLNTVVIRDREANLKIYRTLIEMLDVPTPIIQVDVLALALDESKLTNSGINWWATAPDKARGGFGGNNLASTMAPGISSLAAAYGNVNPANMIVSNVAGFFAALQFLEQHGDAKTETKTALVTTDNISAFLNMKETFYTKMANENVNNATEISASNMLSITPHVIFEDAGVRKIKLDVTLKDGDVEEKVVNNLPTSTQGVIKSQAVINEGDSLLLAGYAKTVTEEVKTEVPLLSKIPILGWFFKTEGIKKRRYHHSYLISPTVLWAKGMSTMNTSLIQRQRSIKHHTSSVMTTNSSQFIERKNYRKRLPHLEEDPLDNEQTLEKEILLETEKSK